MTLQEAKDKVAQKHGYDSWKNFEHYNVHFGHYYDHNKYLEEAAELYAESCKREAWDKACEAQKKVCFYGAELEEICIPEITYKLSRIKSLSILTAPNAEYKV